MAVDTARGIQVGYVLACTWRMKMAGSNPNKLNHLFALYFFVCSQLLRELARTVNEHPHVHNVSIRDGPDRATVGHHVQLCQHHQDTEAGQYLTNNFKKP